MSRGGIFNNCRSIYHSPLVVTSIFLPWRTEPMPKIQSEKVAKGPYQKETACTEPTIDRLQISPYCQQSYPGPSVALHET